MSTGGVRATDNNARAPLRPNCILFRTPSKTEYATHSFADISERFIHHMRTWVRKTLSVGVLAAGALLFAPGAAHADVTQDSSGANSALNGTQLVAPVNVPLNIVGNAIGVAGEANAAATGANRSTEGATAGQSSSGHNGIANGTQAYLPINVPINVVGNAAGVLGQADAAASGTNGKTESATTTAGGQDSSGSNGILNGTQLYAPVDVPINLCGNDLGLLGAANAQAMCSSSGHSTEGGTATQDSSNSTGIANGTQIYAPISLPVNLAGNSAGILGEGTAAATGSNESGQASGAPQSSTGALNGTQVTAPVHVPVTVCGDALGILGQASASASCTGGTQPGDDNGGDQGGYPGGGDNGGDGGTQGGSYGQSARKSQAKAATEASPVDGLTKSVGQAGGLTKSVGQAGDLNAAGLGLLSTLR
jgi:ChpA-C